MAKSSKLAAQTTPFCIAEWVYKKGQKEIHALKDGTLLNDLLELRQSYPVLTAAGSMAQTLLHSQLPAKPAHDLYELFTLYLKKLPTFRKPEILVASFRFKLLIHEGLFSPEQDSFFTTVEWQQIEILAFSRKFSTLESVESAPLEKIQIFFEEKMRY